MGSFLQIALALLPVIKQAVVAVDVVANETPGKPLDEVVQDVINHLTPGAPDAPALGPNAGK